MNPTVWIALAYGVVAVTLIIYTVRLRRRVRRAEAEDRERDMGTLAQPSTAS